MEVVLLEPNLAKQLHLLYNEPEAESTTPVTITILGVVPFLQEPTVDRHSLLSSEPIVYLDISSIKSLHVHGGTFVHLSAIGGLSAVGNLAVWPPMYHSTSPSAFLPPVECLTQSGVINPAFVTPILAFNLGIPYHLHPLLTHLNSSLDPAPYIQPSSSPSPSSCPEAGATQLHTGPQALPSKAMHVLCSMSRVSRNGIDVSSSSPLTHSSRPPTVQQKGTPREGYSALQSASKLKLSKIAAPDMQPVRIGNCWGGEASSSSNGSRARGASSWGARAVEALGAYFEAQPR
jgi:uncharacterized membrane protein YqaE (UPF0057 family)